MNEHVLEVLKAHARDLPPPPPHAPIRMPFPYVGPHGCDVCGCGTMDLAVTFDPSKPCPECGATFATDFRAIVRAALTEPTAPTQHELAVAVAPKWGVKPKSAEESISKWLSGELKQLPLVAIQTIFDALRRKVIGHEEPVDVVVFVNGKFRSEERCASRAEAKRYMDGARYMTDLFGSSSVTLYVLPDDLEKMVSWEAAGEVKRARERVGQEQSA